jgi:hypothetical protein
MEKFDSQGLNSKLSNFVLRPIGKNLLSDPFINPTYKNRHLRANNTVELELEARLADEFFQKICALQPANPSKLSRVAKLNASFEDAYDNNINKLKTYLNMQSELEVALRQSDRVAFVGRRGSGKTTILNKWLNERTSSFFETERGLNYVWFRIDASKIYNSLRRSGVKAYYTAHSVFVFLLYSGMITIDDESPSDFFRAILRDIPKGNIDNTIEPFCRRLNDVISHLRVQISLGDKSVAAVETIISSTLYMKQAEEIYGLMVAALEKRTIGTVCIIDGIDNVSYSKKNSKYQTMCAEMRMFFADYFMKHPNLKKKLLLASRPETIPELEIRAIGTNYKAANDFIEVLYRTVSMPVVEPARVLRKKIDAIKCPEFFAERQAFVTEMQKLHPNDSEIEVINARIRKYGETNFERLVREELNDILVDFQFSNRSFYVSRLEEGSFLTDFFDGDVRAYLAAFRRVAHGKRYYVALNIQNVDSVELIPEIFVLSGRIYKTSAFSVSEGRERYFRPNNADLFPNIFWYEASGRAERVHQWYGLCGLRLLQLAMFREKRVYEVAKILNILFDYPFDVIEEVVQTFVAYGLINVEHDDERYVSLPINASDPLFAENPLAEHRAIISTTRKGRICATLSLVYFKWVYFLALDTPLLRFFLPDDSGANFIRFYKSFSDPIHSEFNFWDAVIPTSSVLLKHIFHFHKREMANIKDRIGQRRISTLLSGYGDFNALADWFSLPARLGEHHLTTFTHLLRTRFEQASTGGRDEVGYQSLIRVITDSMDAANEN